MSYPEGDRRCGSSSPANAVPAHFKCDQIPALTGAFCSMQSRARAQHLLAACRLHGRVSVQANTMQATVSDLHLWQGASHPVPPVFCLPSFPW